MGVNTDADLGFMQLAYAQAEQAAAQDEVPVGAVVVLNGKLISEAHNSQITSSNPTAHAEILALQLAAVKLGNYRLPDCELYVTLEPCMMCVGAMVHARIKRLIYGAPDNKTGMAETVEAMFEKPFHNHRVNVIGGVMAEQCGRLLSQFFQHKRRSQKTLKIKD